MRSSNVAAIQAQKRVKLQCKAKVLQIFCPLMFICIFYLNYVMTTSLLMLSINRLTALAMPLTYTSVSTPTK